MSREKQIEEMVRVYNDARLKASETLGSMNKGEAWWYSEALYNASYRKQSEGEWLTDRYGMERSICSLCGATYEGDGGNYCRNCGAKMKGGAE